MGVLKNLTSGQLMPLIHESLVGRSALADLRLADRRVSSHHASLRWDQSSWLVRDLGSHNGTLLDGARLEAGKDASLMPGARLFFGSTEQEWELVCSGAPQLAVRRMSDGQLLLADQGCLPLSETLVLAWEGGRACLVEEGHRFRAVEDGDILHLDGEAHRLVVPPLGERGATCTAVESVFAEKTTLVFVVDADHKPVQVRLRAPGIDRALKPRVFDGLLLNLAAARNAAMAEQPIDGGWVEVARLAELFQRSRHHLNIDVYRARARFEKAGVVDPEKVLERSPAGGALRLGVAVEIVATPPI